MDSGKFKSCCANLLSNTSEKHQHLLLLQTWASRLHHFELQHSFKQPPLTGFGSKHFPLACWQLRTSGLIRPFPQARLDGRYQSELQHLKLASPRVSMYIVTDSRDLAKLHFRLAKSKVLQNVCFQSYSKDGLDVSCLIITRKSHVARSPKQSHQASKKAGSFPGLLRRLRFTAWHSVGHQAKQNRLGNLEQPKCLKQISQQ